MTHQNLNCQNVEEFDIWNGPMVKFLPGQVHLVGLELKPNRSLELLVSHFNKDVPETWVSIWFDCADSSLPSDSDYELVSFEDNLEPVFFPKEVSVNPRDFLTTPNRQLDDLVNFVLAKSVISNAQLVVGSRDHVLYSADHPVLSLYEGKAIDDWTVDGYHPELDIGFYLMLGDYHVAAAARSADMPYVFKVLHDPNEESDLGELDEL